MELKEAIYTRRSVRNYKDEVVAKELINKLIDAGIHAPTAKNSQPWAFAVIQDKQLLKQVSDETTAYFLSTLDNSPSAERSRSLLQNPDFNIFYNATTLLVIYAKPETPTPDGPMPEYDCCLAAENIMFAAHSMGLGTCWIGFAMPYLNSVIAKEKLGTPADYTAVATLIVGYPAKDSTASIRKEPEILLWK